MAQTETWVAVVGMLVSFALPVLLVGMILWFKHRKLRMTHETIARLAERGLPVPPELLAPVGNPRTGLRSGLVLLALGIALAVFLEEVGAPWSIGLIPGLMGTALVIAAFIESRWARSNPPR